MNRGSWFAVAGVTLAGTVFAVWLGLRVVHPTLGPTLRAVSNDRLAQDGILLMNPFPWDKPETARPRPSS
jgi:hypothetical protein